MTELSALHALPIPATAVRINDDPCIDGTNVEVYRIAALLAGGSTVGEIMEDYPGLSARQIQNAVSYAEVFPNRGCPYPEQSFKRATQALGLDVLDKLLAVSNWADDAR